MSVTEINGATNPPVYTPGKAKGNVSNNNFSKQINKTKAGSFCICLLFDGQWSISGSTKYILPYTDF